MILFMIKKAFFDMWDNLLSIVLLNLGGILLLGASLYIPYIFSFHPILPLVGIVLSAVMLVLYIGAVSMVARDIADYRSPDFKPAFCWGLYRFGFKGSPRVGAEV